MSTTPNSPSVCAKVRIIAVRMPGHASGASMRRKRCHGDRPQQAAASRTSAGIASKARWIGWITKGRLMMIEASTSPGNEKASEAPASRSKSAPTVDRGLKTVSR